jgi:hypothetical protein
MTRRIMMTAVIAAASAAALAAWAGTMIQERQSVSRTGCLRTGSTSTVYLLRGATAPAPGQADSPGAGAAAIPEDFLLVPGSGIDLAPMVNHRITVTGEVSEAKDPPPPPSGANTAEKALKKISVQNVKEVASNCALE